MSLISSILLVIAACFAGVSLSACASTGDAPAAAASTKAAESKTIDAAEPATRKRAYMLIEARITDMARFGRYAQAIIPIVQRHGGRYIVMRGSRETLEGDFGDTRVVISEWPTMDAARAFWNDPEYREAVKLREGTGEFRILLMEGVDAAPAGGP